MKGKVYRRCSRARCRKRLAPKARRCDCGNDRYTWYFVVDVARSGERRQAKRGGFASREEAELALAEILQEVDADSFVEPSTITVEEFLTEQWLPAVHRWPGYYAPTSTPPGPTPASARRPSAPGCSPATCPAGR